MFLLVTIMAFLFSVIAFVVALMLFGPAETYVTESSLSHTAYHNTSNQEQVVREAVAKGMRLNSDAPQRTAAER